MRFGPISSLDLTRLEDQLKRHGIEYHVDVSQKELDAYAELRMESARTPEARPEFKGMMNYIYLEIPDGSVALVQDELDRLGYGNYAVTGDELNSDPEFDALVRARNAKRATAAPEMRFVYTVAFVAALAAAIWFVIRELSNINS